MMHLVQILLPLKDNNGNPFPDALIRGIQKELSDHFGGVTAYTRAPAEGIWRGEFSAQKEDIIIIEVMTSELNRDWWHQYRRSLEKVLAQDEIVMRAQNIEKL